MNTPFVRRSVLVVDDVPGNVESIAMLLRRHNVRTALSGIDALRLIEQAIPDVVLLDIGMPEMDGLEVARRIRERWGKDIFLVAITGYGMEDDYRKTEEAGFDRHIVKPYEPEDLLQIVESPQRKGGE